MTKAQLEALRKEPLGTARNKVRAALELTKQQQVDIVHATGMAASDVSNIVNGRYGDLQLTTCQRFATFFGVSVDDLFPSRAA